MLLVCFCTVHEDSPRTTLILAVDIMDGVLFGSSPVRPTKLYHGSCHCGQVAWEVNLGTPEHILCHCDTCKKLGGGPFSLNQIVDRV